MSYKRQMKTDLVFVALEMLIITFELVEFTLCLWLGHVTLDTEMESCEHERSIMKRRLAASAIEIERQVKGSSI